MRYALLVVAIICSVFIIKTNPAWATEYDRAYDCFMAAIDRANAQHCDEYKKAISCGETMVAFMQGELSHLRVAKAQTKMRQAITDQQGANAAARGDASKNGCKVD